MRTLLKTVFGSNDWPVSIISPSSRPVAIQACGYQSSGALTITVSGGSPSQDAGYIGHWIGAGDAVNAVSGSTSAGLNGRCQITALLGSNQFTCATNTTTGGVSNGGLTFTTTSYVNSPGVYRWSVGYPPISDVSGKSPAGPENGHYTGWYRAGINGAVDFALPDSATAETFAQTNWPASQAWETQMNIEPR